MLKVTYYVAQLDQNELSVLLACEGWWDQHI